MAYKKPTCDCGEELDYEKEVSKNEIFEITKQGKVKKKSFRLNLDLDSGIEYLICPSCNKRYAVELDDRSRLVRGELAF